MKQLTRRNLLATAATAVPLAALAQDPSATKAASRDEDLKSARESIASNAEQLAKVEVPITIEPAFVFKA